MSYFTNLKKYCIADIEDILKCKKYAYIDNKSDVLAVAHCDTLFDSNTNKTLYAESREYILSPMLDDRAGVFTILNFLPQFYPNIKYDILLTRDEEKGASTAQFFKSLKQYNWIFEFDRRGTDTVLYDYEFSYEWLKAVSENFKIGFGSYSDISSLTHLKCCALNIGTAYYNQHHINSYLNKNEYLKQIKRFSDFYFKNRNKCFKFDDELVNDNFYYDEIEDFNHYNGSFYDYSVNI